MRISDWSSDVCSSDLFMRNLDYELYVFTLAHDADSRIKPDFGLEIPAGFRAWFPWERSSITPAFDQTLNCPERPEYDYTSWAIDLDGVLLMDLPEHQYAPIGRGAGRERRVREV